MSGNKRGRIITIFKFINDETFNINDDLFKINEYKVSDYLSCKMQKLFLIWEDKISQKFYLRASSSYLLKFMEISDNKNEYDFKIIESDKTMELDLLACVINNKNKKDYLYLYNNGLLTIFDLNEKIIINKIKIIKDIISITKWTNKYIILSTRKSIYTFDININKVINKYLINTNGEIISIKKFNIDKINPSYLCFDSTDQNIVIM